MNLAAQAPTKTIQLKINPLVNMFLEQNKKMNLWKNEKSDNLLDFYSIVSDEEDHLYQKQQTPTNTLQNNIDFIILALKNDLRVKTFKYQNTSFYINFWCIQDSISFYKQYFKVAEMSFSDGFEHIDFMFHEDDKEKRNGLVDELCCNVYKRNKSPVEEKINVNAEEKESKIEFFDHSNVKAECQTFLSLKRRIKEFSSKEEFLNPFNTHEVVSYKELPLESIKVELKNAIKFQNINLNKPVIISSNCKKEQFISRIEYFNKMRNFYSKNDVKKMENLLKTGNFEFLFLNSKEVSCGCFSNKIMQDAIKTMKEEEKCMLIKNLGYDICPLASTKYGAYSIQSIIMACESKESQKLLSGYFERYGEYLISHEIGNYAVQKILRFDEELIFDLCMKNLKEIVENDLGIKVFKRCLSFFNNKKEIILEKMNNIVELTNKERCENIIAMLFEN